MIKRIFFVLVALLIFSHSFSQWKTQYKNDLVKLNSIFFVDNNNGWAVGENGVILNFNGTQWKLQKSNITYDLYSVYFIDKNNGWAVGDSGIIKYDGSKWESQLNGALYGFISVFFTDINNGWVAKSCCDLLKYDGKKWYKPNTGILTNLRILYLFDSKNGWLGGPGGKLYKLNDTIWEPKFLSTTDYDIYSLSFTNSSNGWAVGRDQIHLKGIILKYINTQWNNDTIGINSILYGVFFRNNNLGWAVGEKGAIYKYNGYKWEKQVIIDNKGAIIRGVYFIDDKKGWAVNWMGEILYTDNGGDSTTSINQNSNHFPFEIDAYPNPFSTQTTIKYSLKKSERVLITIYDGFSRKISTIKDEFQESGDHKVDFYSSNLTSGIYYFTLQTNFYRESRRIILIK